MENQPNIDPFKMTMRLECRNIAFKYPDSRQYVFKNLSLDISKPGFHALFGPSGIGKTSLARIITGDINGFSGEVKTVGIHSLLYSYNMERLPGWSSVGKHLDKITPRLQIPKRETLVDVFGLKTHLGSRFSQLSLGQKNRVNLLRYLLQDFQLLIMDESLANVDELTRGKILLKIKALFPDVIFLYISHNVVEVSKYCDHIFVFRAVHRQPQIVPITGQNHHHDAPVKKRSLEATMLEIMNAS